MLLKILLIYSLTICKRTLKRIYKRICKNKTCGASVVQNVENEKEINPCASYENILVYCEPLAPEKTYKLEQTS